MNVENRIKLERRIVRAIVTAAVKAGHNVSVYDGEDWPLKRSGNVAEIMQAVMSTDEDTLHIRSAQDGVIGDVYLVYGNDGWDVIADHTSSPEMDAILAPAMAIADKYA